MAKTTGITTNLLQLLEAEHTKQQCDRIIKYVGSDKDRFAELVRLFLKGEYRITQRAAWPLSYCVRQHPELMLPYYKKVLDNLAKNEVHVSVTRNTLRLLQYVMIPKKYHGQVMSICFDFIQSPDTPIAVRAFSLTLLGHLSKDYPDIKSELRLIIEEQWEHATPAFRSRARKFFKGLAAGDP